MTASLERHLEACLSRRGENDPTVVAAYQDVADAFDLYDDALLEAYGEVTPLVIYNGDDEEEDELDDSDYDDEDDDEDDEELDDHSDEDGDSAGVYLGLDDSDYDEEPSNSH
ncbi:MAG: primosomal protein [Dermatophilaceae bacterium]